MSLAQSPWRHRVDGHDVQPLDHGWEAAVTDGSDPLTWRPARVPGTAAGVLRDAGVAIGGDLDGQEWSFRTTFEAAPAGSGEEVVLRLDGVATLAEVELNGERLVDVGSMFESHEVEVGDRLRGTNELVIRCLPLAPALEVQRKPRARWRTNLVADGRLRWFRTMILGRAPGFAPGPPAVGPWRPVWLVRRRGLVVEALTLRPSLDGDVGLLRAEGRVRPLDGTMPDSIRLELDGPSGRHAIALELAPGGDGITFRGTLQVPSVERWWPHTHGVPALHDVRLLIGSGTAATAIEAGRVGFRTLTAGPGDTHDIERDGLDLHVNGVRTFARGALWTPTDIVGFATTAADLRSALEAVRDAGMNMVRLPGTGAYETDAFHDLCDELGLLVWQDFMFANLDYPFADDAFRALAEREATDAPRAPGGSSQHGRAMREQRDRATGGDAGARPGARSRRLLRVDAARPRGRRRERRDLRALGAVRRRPAVPPRPGRRQLLRRRRLPPAPDRRTGRRRPLRVRVPRVRERPRRRGHRVDAARRHDRRRRPPPGVEGRRAPRRRDRLGLRRRARPLPRAAVRTRPGRAPARRPRSLSRAVPCRDRRGDGRGLR